MPVVALSQGNRVGTVKDLVIDLDRRAVAALVLDDSAQGALRLVPFESIRRLGRDAVMVEDQSSVVAASDRPRLRELAESRVRMIGMKVLSEDGEALGTVSDVVVDEDSGAIEEYQVSSGVLRDLLGGRTYVSADAPRAVGDEFIVVPRSAVMAGRPLEEGPPLVLESPPWHRRGERVRELEHLAAELLARQADLIVGRRAQRTIADEDPGGVVVFQGETITEEVVQRAKAAGKLHELIEFSGGAASAAKAGAGPQRYAELAVGRMARRTVRTPRGEVILSQGDVVTPVVVERARQAGVVDQLADAVRTTPAEAASAARQRAARSLWDQVSERIGRLTGRR